MSGYAENGAVPRYWLGATYLLEGLPLIPVVLGLFALPEVIDLAVRNSSISRVPADRVAGGMMTGIGDAWRNWWLVLRCTAIGAYVGMLPGLGGSIVDWVAYGHVVQSSKDKEGFGKGDVRGVIAPETANNAMKGGALIPTVAFGIPGSASMAILLGALLIQGMTPGPEMLTSKLHITFSMMWTLVIANVAGALLLMLLARQVARVTFRPGQSGGAGGGAVRVHGRVARQRQSRRLDRAADLRRRRLCDEAGRRPPAAHGAGLRDRPDHGERAVHHQLGAMTG